MTRPCRKIGVQKVAVSGKKSQERKIQRKNANVSKANRRRTRTGPSQKQSKHFPFAFSLSSRVSSLNKKRRKKKKQYGIKIANFLVIYLNDCKKRCDPKELRFDYCLQRLLKDETKNQVSKLDTRGGKDDGNTESDNAIVLRWFLNKSPRYAITCEKRMW